ncbi:MAG: YraN family protein [Anaerolineae bacterium]|nr:YraN family protein [Anaerolineae bacterium]MCB9106112.1 YraN family protein [Anaerolineales bacterium]
MDRRQQTGRRGEEIAAAYFTRLGFRILDRNWRCPIGELDIVMEQGDTLIFVEVRTRRGQRYGSPEESVTPNKQARLIELAHSYIQHVQPSHPQWRIDIAAVQLDQKPPQINHIENAVGW